MADSITGLLFETGIDTHVVLCNLSIIRQVYSDTDHVVLNGKLIRDERLNESRVTLLQEGVDQFLVKMMCVADVTVVYTASKALVCFLTSDSISVEELKTFLKYSLDNFRKEMFHTLGNVYILQVFTEVLKQLKHKGCSLIKLECCLSLFTSCWLNIVNYVLKKSSILKPINQFLLQFLKFMLQLFRCYSVACTNKDYVFVLQTIPSIYNSVKLANCLMCWTTLVNVLKKSLAFPACNEVIVPVAQNMFSSQEFPLLTLLINWIAREESYVLSSILLGFGVFSENYCELTCTIATLKDQVSKTLLRRSFLLSLSLALISQQTMHFQSALNSLCTISDVIGSCVTVPYHIKQEFSQCIILYLLSEQDTSLVELLMRSLALSKAHPMSIPCLKIHSLFVTFLHTISFDHSTVLDFIVSAETDFDIFFKNYTSFLKEGEQLNYFIGACKERDNFGIVLTAKDETAVQCGKKRPLQENASSLLCKRQNLETNTIEMERTDGDNETEVCRLDAIYRILNMLISLSSSLNKVHRRKLVTDEKLLTVSEIATTSDKIIKNIASYIFE